MTGKRVKTLRKKLPNSETAQLGERGKKLGQPLLIFRAGVNYVTAFSLSFIARSVKLYYLGSWKKSPTLDTLHSI